MFLKQKLDKEALRSHTRYPNFTYSDNDWINAHGG